MAKGLAARRHEKSLRNARDARPEGLSEAYLAEKCGFRDARIFDIFEGEGDGTSHRGRVAA